MFTLLLLLILVVCVLMLWMEGLFRNAITLINAVLAGLIATNYFEPAADWIEGMLPSYTYLWDFLAFWLLFTIAFGLMRTATDLLVRRAVRFKMPVEYPGRVVLAALVGYVMIQLAAFSIHLAPVAPQPFGILDRPDGATFLFLAPDRQWLGFVQSRSRGALARGDRAARSAYPEDAGRRVFDPQGEFTVRYHQRRANLAKLFAETEHVRVSRN